MSSRTTFLYCAGALLLFALIAFTAVSTKSATYDEPDHVATSYVALRYGDFRVEPDHPVLWKYWAALPLVLFGPPINANIDTPVFRNIPVHVESVFPWCVATVYQTPGNDPDRIIPPARFMMLLLGVALGAVTALFAYRAAGPIAACVAVTLFAFDPNFLAHSPLVKNDVALTLFTTALAYALWRLGQALTLPRVLAVAFLCAACVTTKLTGILAAPIAVTCLVIRALIPTPWPAFRRTLSGRSGRLIAAVSVCVACFLITYVFIWAVYLFRFNPSPDPAVHYDTSQFLAKAAEADLAVRGIASPTPADVAAWRPGGSLRVGLFALEHRLLPEPFLEGLIFARAASTDRPGYALDHIYRGGRWFYFPLALLTKSPLTTLAVVILLPLAALIFCRRDNSVGTQHLDAWLWVCLLAPVVLFLLTSIPSSVNIGLRHIFPILPPLYVVAGLFAARLYAARPRVVRPALMALALTLFVETVSAYPNFIPFFNVVAGGYRGGFHLLGDSNLDWGQDLPLLAAWQEKHPDRVLHFAYFGMADPATYGIRYLNAPKGYPYGPEAAATVPTSGVLAVSASVLQGVSDPDAPSNPYAAFRNRRPTEILGGSIYLFDLDVPRESP